MELELNFELDTQRSVRKQYQFIIKKKVLEFYHKYDCDLHRTAIEFNIPKSTIKTFVKSFNRIENQSLNVPLGRKRLTSDQE